ncbi:radical SAM/SPASM domain-containing protein [Ruminococcus flavefaciens]|uniref:radical SAM/SPASM domain-containing protein n=1 Tax=Ruminococcus flavefaciens TaxID=1265 RepID=UPI0003130309|nr:radical SAM protein [Ruminococcus flavefaciens]
MQNYINLLMIPTDYCNLRCKYCFFDKNIKSFNRMNEDTLYQTMKIILPYYDRVSFVWHGGEPLSMGLDFYKTVVKIQKEFSNCTNIQIHNSIQSNLTLLTDEMSIFFAQNKFSISTSYDGVCNEITRGNSQQILSGRSICLDHQDHCGIIMVTSKININSLIESYHFFKMHDMDFKINPYLGIDKELVLDYNLYTEKMWQLFYYWAIDSDTNIEISSFNSIIDYILFHKKKLCTFTSCLGRWASINYNGTIKPCNRYFPDEYSYGNVFDYNSFREAFDSEGFRRIIIKAIKRRNKCKSCEIFDYCSGGCNYVAMTENGGIENNNGNYCQYLKIIYKQIETFLLEHKSDRKLNKFLKNKIEKAKNHIKY